LGYNNKKVSANKTPMPLEESLKLTEEKKVRKIPGIRYEDEEDN